MDANNETKKQGMTAWKGVEHLEQHPEHTQWVGDEFPHRRDLPTIDRRDFLKFVGGSVALAGLASGCRFLPERKIVPYVQQPEDMIPGKNQYFATANILSGYATGLLVASYEGRPIKIEGNPKHPASLGGISALHMAETMNLYDPDRLKTVQNGLTPSSWKQFLSGARESFAEGGRGVVILTEIVSSPTLAASIQTFLQKNPGATWRQWEPVNHDNVREGAMRAFGQDLSVTYDFSKAKIVLAIDADFMQYSNAPDRYQHELMDRRDVDKHGEDMSRIYAVEAYPTLTGAVADHRVPLRPSLMLAFAKALAGRLGVAGAESASLPSGIEERFLSALASDLQSNPGAAVVVPGEQHDPALHAICHAINEQLGAFGQTVKFTTPVLPKPVGCLEEIKALASDIAAGRVHSLIILGGNPVYNAPSDLKLGELIKEKVKFSAHLTLAPDETGEVCNWEMPMSHFLEAWGDATNFDGSHSIVQPLIEPMYDSKSALELMDNFNGGARNGHDIVREHWSGVQTVASPATTPSAPVITLNQPVNQTGIHLPDDSHEIAPHPQPAPASVMLSAEEEKWNVYLADGVFRTATPLLVAGLPPAGSPVIPTITSGLVATVTAPTQAQGLDIMFLPDPTIYDGRNANNPWLQELPKPITNMTWDNAFYLSYETAVKLGLERKEVIGTKELEIPQLGLGRHVGAATLGGATVKAAVASNIGQADDTIVFHLGYGRRRAGQIGTARDQKEGGGFDAYQLRSTTAQGVASGASLEKTGEFYVMANVQFHNALETGEIDSGRHIIQEATLAAYLSGEPLVHVEGHGGGHDEDSHGDEHHDEGHAEKAPASTMYDPTLHDHSETNYQWAMTIDLNLCNGCGACVMACQSENNIPVVGKHQVQKGREMHWIRIDRYYMGSGSSLDTKNAPIRFQPLACVQCENAPCEPVCPVAATVHSHEGINQMVYNRCVGTRYCSNNCPYKVRRFNFLHYTAKTQELPVLQMLQNPRVTVRTRGVMEKCTYCIQRINETRIDAKKDNRKIKDGEIVTACQQACPSGGIVFGDKRDPNSRVSKTRKDRRNYVLLESTNTVPRTTYLMKITNPNPELHTEAESHGA